MNAVGTEDQKFKFEGREGLFTQTKSVHDRYAERPNLVENLTLSQFVTSYTNCKKLPKKYKLFNNASKETGLICEHLTGLSLPLYIRLSTNENFRLRRFSTVLQLHSSKKDGDEEFFAEVQLFSLWRRPDLDDWRNNCIEEFQKRKDIIEKVQKKTFPFSMTEMIEEIKGREALNPISDDFGEALDANGAQENDEIENDGLEETARLNFDFTEWHDDTKVHEYGGKSVDAKFRPLEMISKDELLTKTKALVPEQTAVL